MVYMCSSGSPDHCICSPPLSPSPFPSPLFLHPTPSPWPDHPDSASVQADDSGLTEHSVAQVGPLHLPWPEKGWWEESRASQGDPVGLSRLRSPGCRREGMTVSGHLLETVSGGFQGPLGDVELGINK